MPIKSIGNEKGKEKLQTTYTLSTSRYFNKALCDAFKISEETILNIGLPRNTRLFSIKTHTCEKLNIPLNTNVIFWLPTYRTSVEGDIRIDGIDYGNVVNIPNFNIEQFSKELNRLNCFCFIKPHPMSKYDDISDYAQIKIINDSWLYDNKLTLYEALSVCDVLITDISSVLVDFLLVDKPIIIAFPDKEAYINNRGLSTKSFFDNLPGPYCISQIDVQDNLKLIFNNQDFFSDNRKRLRMHYHENVDYKNCLENLERHIFNKNVKN